MKKSFLSLLLPLSLLLFNGCSTADGGFEGSEVFVKDYEQRTALFGGTDYLKVLDGELDADRRQALQFLYAYMPTNNHF